MKWVLVAVGAYFGLAWLKGRQLSAALDACGGPSALVCPQRDAVLAKWAWFPDPSRLAGPL